MFNGSGSFLIGTGIGFGELAPVGQTQETIVRFTPEALALLHDNGRSAGPTPWIARSPVIEVVNPVDFKPLALRSKYLHNAEEFAKANGCLAPVATMRLAVVGPENFETLAVACGTAQPMSVRCDSGQCRAM